MDTLLADPVFGKAFAPAQISVLGFSMGGTTALQLGGARMDRAEYRRYCDRVGEAAADCLFFAKGGVDLAKQHAPRITNIIAIDPGIAHTMTAQSVAQLC